MPGIPIENMNTLGNWFPLGETISPSSGIFKNNSSTSLNIESVVKYTIYCQMVRLFYLNEVPANITKLIQILQSSQLNLRSGNDLVQQFLSNKERYELRYLSAHSISDSDDIQRELLKRLAEQLKQAHIRYTITPALYTSDDLEYYFKQQGGYLSLLTIFQIASNWLTTYVPYDAFYLDSTASTPNLNTMIVAARCWCAIKYAQNNYEGDIPIFEYSLYPKGQSLGQ